MTKHSINIMGVFRQWVTRGQAFHDDNLSNSVAN